MHDDPNDETGPEQIGDLVGHIGDARALQPQADPQPEPPRESDLAIQSELAELRRGWRTEQWARLVPRRYASATIDDLPADLGDDMVRDLRAWTVRPDRNVVLLGPVGTGKTHLAWALLREPFLNGLTVQGGSLLRVLDAMRPGGIAKALAAGTDQLCTADVAFLDDLGVESATEWTVQQVHRIIDDRHADVLPTVATSNLDPEPLKGAIGEAAYSRLVGSGAIVLRLAGDDRRRKRP